MLRLRGPCAFWLLGVAVTIGYNAICSELSRLAAAWGDSVLLKINIAFYLPSVPLLLLGTLLDQHIDKSFGWQRTNMLRVTAGFGGCAAVLAAFPFLQASLAHLLALVVALGVFSATAAGSSYQLATQQDDGGSATVAVTLGYVSSAPVVLLAEAGWRIGPLAAWPEMVALYGTVAAISACALAGAVMIVRRQQQQQQDSWVSEPLLQLPLQQASDWADQHKQAWLAEGTAGSATPAATAGSPSLRNPLDDEASADVDVDVDVDVDGGSIAGNNGASNRTLLAMLWPAAVSLFLNVGCSMLLFPLFTHFRSSGALGHCLLPVVLFWSRAFADVAGRVLPKLLWGPPPSATIVLCLAVLRIALLPLPMLRIAGRLPSGLQSDWLLVAYVGLQWLGSGAVSVWSFLLVPRLVPSDLGNKAAYFMTLVLNTSCLVGLLLAIPAQSLTGS